MSWEAGDREYPYFDEAIQSLVCGHYGEWMVSVTPMIYNDRIILTREDQYPWFSTAGYCYDKGGSAPLAALVWNPLEERDPTGFKKLAFDERPVSEATQ